MVNLGDVCVEVKGLKELPDLWLEKTIQTEPGKRRLYDTFFNAIFFEIMFNAARRSRPITVGIESLQGPEGGASGDCITFTNPIAEYDADNMSFLSEDYTRWPTTGETQGGLSHIATKLDIARQGVLYGKKYKRGKKWYFSLALRLDALRRKECSHHE
jgi:hypothetical protein